MSAPPCRSVSALCIGPEGTLWLGDADAGGLWRSDDGASWQPVDAGRTGTEPRALVAGHGRLFLGDGAAGVVRSIDAAGVARAIAADDAAALAVDDDADALYLARRSAATVCRVDLGGDDREVDELAVLPRPAGALVLSPDRRRLYASIGDAVAAIEVATGLVSTAVTVPGGALRGLAVTPAGLATADHASGRILGLNLRHRSVACIAADLDRPGALVWDRPRRRFLAGDARGLVAAAPDGTGSRPL